MSRRGAPEPETIAARVRDLERRVEVLEARPAPASRRPNGTAPSFSRPDDRAVVLAVAEAIGSATFTVAELLEHSTTAPALRTVLAARRLTNARRLGKRLARLEGFSVGDFRVVRVAVEHSAVLWSIVPV